MNTLIVIPAFNEKENIARLIGAIKKEKIKADILVVDDNSSDGTGKIVGKIRSRDKSVFVLRREKKEDLGRACVAGLKWALGRDYERILSMDADFSHPPSALGRMLELSGADTVVIGSRYVKGGRIVGWSWRRYLNSRGANLITRGLLRIRAKDATAGFKCYPAEFLRKIDLDKVQAGGYAFQVEMLLRAQEGGFELVETPITFVDRVAGQSKIQGELIRSATLVLRLAAGKKSYRQFTKFAIVGAVNTGVDWAVFYPVRMLILQGFPEIKLQNARQIAKACSFAVSALSSYIMNRKWTFRSKNKKVAREAVKFLIVAGVGLVINSSAFYLVTAKFAWRDIFGLIAATASATLWNFLINKNWTFRK